MSTPNLECDIIMQGGITSGIVYPSAILKLKDKYRFCNIGGASAGGIVAALTAAAEYGRQTNSGESFVKLQQATDELREEGRMRDLFQPDPKLRAPFEVFLAVTKGKSDIERLWLYFKALLKTTLISFLLGAVIFSIFWVGLWSVLKTWLTQLQVQVPLVVSIPIMLVLLVVMILLGGVLGGTVRLIRTLWSRLPYYQFGICSGLRNEKDSRNKPLPLTDWLCSKLDEIAGKGVSDTPLTFGDLKEKKISFQTVTTNLSQRIPMTLPFKQNNLIFNEDELRKVFPEKIVQHLIARAAKYDDRTLQPKFHFLPQPDDIPILFAVRLTLSFPILLTAIPLYTYHGNNGQTPILKKNWFSDGGICSNFPIHLFDAWYPRRPTFGIQLVDMPSDAFQGSEMGDIYSTRDSGERYEDKIQEDIFTSDSEDESYPTRATQSKPSSECHISDPVYLSPANRVPPTAVVPFNGIMGFLLTIFSTTQNYRDNTQSQLPGYRERIVQVRLKSDEGGLNLDMPLDKVDGMLKKGERVGEILSSFEIRQHQWVRYITLMGRLEAQMKRLGTVLSKEEFEALLKAMQEAREQKTAFPYKRNAGWSRKASNKMEALFTLMDTWDEDDLFQFNSPSPTPALRVTPDTDSVSAKTSLH